MRDTYRSVVAKIHEIGRLCRLTEDRAWAALTSEDQAELDDLEHWAGAAKTALETGLEPDPGEEKTSDG